MKQKLNIWILTVFVILALCGCSQRVEVDETSESVIGTKVNETNESTSIAVQEMHFSCGTQDKNGEWIHGFYREVDDSWYLFVPSYLEIADVSLFYQGEIAGASCGELDQKTGIVTDAFEKNGDQVTLTGADGCEYAVKVMQSDLPSLQIDLNDTTLDIIHQDKDVKFKENSLILTEADGTALLKAENSMEMKGRGNSTWRLYDKKGYQIKFNEKTDVFDMGKAKKWVLLANASDDSMIRNQLVSRMAAKLDMDFVTEFEYVDLWIEGEYRGTYLIGEKVEIGNSRLDLEKDTGALFEQDEAFYEEEDYWFYSDMLQRHFVLKEIVEEEEQFYEDAMSDFEKSVDELAQYLYETPSLEVTLEQLGTMIDVDSFAKYYLINEYVLNKESFATSFYWYKDGADDVIHLGPIWDFDTCMGNDGAANTDRYGENHILFKYLLAIPEFRTRTLELYDQYQEAFASMKDDVEILRQKIASSAEMNYLRWDTLGGENLKTNAAVFHTTFNEAVSAVATWLSGREESFMIPEINVVNSQISEDGTELHIHFTSDEKFNSVRFAVWNRSSEETPIQWFEAQKENQTWTTAIDLTSFGSEGMYQMDAYGDDMETPIATGCNYAETVAESPYQLQAQMSQDLKTMTITLQDKEPVENVIFAVWSVTEAHDDLQWFAAVRNQDSVWEYKTAMDVFHDPGEFCIDAYEDQNGTMVKLNAATIFVEELKY